MPDMTGFISGVLASIVVLVLSLPLARAYNKSQDKRDARRRARHAKEFALYDEIASDPDQLTPTLIYHSFVILVSLNLTLLGMGGSYYLSTQPQASDDPMNAYYWFNSLLSLALVLTAMFLLVLTYPNFRIFIGLCQAKRIHRVIPFASRNHPNIVAVNVESEKEKTKDE